MRRALHAVSPVISRFRLPVRGIFENRPPLSRLAREMGKEKKRGKGEKERRKREVEEENKKRTDKWSRSGGGGSGGKG